MSSNRIQVGIPCADEQLCFWVGIVFAIFFFGAILAVVISVWRERLRQHNRRRNRRKLSKKNDPP